MEIAEALERISQLEAELAEAAQREAEDEADYQRLQTTCSNLQKQISEANAARERVEKALRNLLAEMRWCSGSSDFNPGGQAYEGWKKGPVVAMEIAEEALRGKEKR